MTSASQTHVVPSALPASKVTRAGVKSQPFFVKTDQAFQGEDQCLNFLMTYF
jgi:hypothetical protein